VLAAAVVMAADQLAPAGQLVEPPAAYVAKQGMTEASFHQSYGRSCHRCACLTFALAHATRGAQQIEAMHPGQFLVSPDHPKATGPATQRGLRMR
jgi:hypothetical protein